MSEMGGRSEAGCPPQGFQGDQPCGYAQKRFVILITIIDICLDILQRCLVISIIGFKHNHHPDCHRHHVYHHNPDSHHEIMIPRGADKLCGQHH